MLVPQRYPPALLVEAVLQLAHHHVQARAVAQVVHSPHQLHTSHTGGAGRAAAVSPVIVRGNGEALPARLKCQAHSVRPGSICMWTGLWSTAHL